MKLVFDAISAFQFEHEFRCPSTKRNCNHVQLIERAYELDLIQERAKEQELLIRHLGLVNKRSRERAIEKLQITRTEWLDVQDLPHKSFASWVDSVFNVAIKAVKELE